MADRQITALLLKKYPEPKLAQDYRNPLELLIAVILSAQCTDAREQRNLLTMLKKTTG